MASSPSWLRRLVATATLAFTLPLFAASEPSLITGQKKSFGYSWAQELKLGAEADKEITEEMGLYDNPELQAYVDRIGQRLVQTSNFSSPNAPQIYRDTKFTFRVLDSAAVNAFALPGGYVYVTRGLLAHAQNEAQLAVVIGHEIAHVGARHHSQQAQRSKWGQLGTAAASILGQVLLKDRAPDLAPTLAKGLGTGVQAFLLRYSREAEHESDQLGVTWATRAGYHASDSVRFFETLKRLASEEGGKVTPTWQSTHPDPGDRAQRIVQLAQATPIQVGQAPTVGEEEFMRRIEGLIVGDDPREGFVSNGVFYHPTLRFQFPVAQGWKSENQKAAFIMAEPNGRAIMGLKLAPGTRARDAAQQFAQQAKVQVVTGGDTQVNGLPATVILGQVQTEDGNLGVWSAFVEYDQKVYHLLGYSPVDAFEQARPVFERVAAGFGPLRDVAGTNVQPTRLKVVRADRAAPFASFVPVSLPPDLSADKIAIMNQVNMNDSIAPGRFLKVPEGGQAPAVRTRAGTPRIVPTTQPQPVPVPANQSAWPSTVYPPNTFPQPPARPR